ncbi:flavin reductase [Marinivivus vitaminiproducens]|uniref:flavin reductase n=1 Tax=Marinivivus vitaminiproducens TaxID=3035935 RepID=UPI0027A97E30|nr:flavin reductase [Geminicoccaceae bacterium SCSIO 64248]
MVTQKAYRDAMARLGAAVNIITTDGPGGRAGFTASAVCSVTDSPPTLLVCMNRNSSVNDAFRANGVLCVNVLAPGQEDLSSLFGGKTEMEARFAAGRWATLRTGAPILDGALASFDCTVAQVAEVGTHSVLFCEVEGLVEGSAADGLIYFARRYHRIVAEVQAERAES